MGEGQERVLEFLQERAEETAAVVKARTTATRNKNKLKVLEEIRRMATAAAAMHESCVEERYQDESEECQKRI